MALAMALGIRLHGLSAGLGILTVVMITLPLGIAATEWLSFPPPWEPHLYAEWRAARRDLRGPGALVRTGAPEPGQRTIATDATAEVLNDV